MAFTYSGNPASSARDFVRFRLGDTDSVAPLLQDEEIDWSLVGRSPLGAAAACADVLAARYSGRIGVSVGPLSIDFAARADAMRALAATFRAEAAGLPAGSPIAPLTAPVLIGATKQEQTDAQMDPLRRPLLSEDVYLPNWEEPIP